MGGYLNMSWLQHGGKQKMQGGTEAKLARVRIAHSIDTQKLQGEIDETRVMLGKLISEACTDHEFKISWCKREIEELEYLIKWIEEHGELT